MQYSIQITEVHLNRRHRPLIRKATKRRRETVSSFLISPEPFKMKEQGMTGHKNVKNLSKYLKNPWSWHASCLYIKAADQPKMQQQLRSIFQLPTSMAIIPSNDSERSVIHGIENSKAI
ncbi:hypothetical protein [Anoxynatronum sibiricum]|uniref:hypothetical protein n=1 Tax=Anoxynatronum sibiricum TaxID=210623 RepID=UPI0031B7EEC2